MGQEDKNRCWKHIPRILGGGNEEKLGEIRVWLWAFVLKDLKTYLLVPVIFVGFSSFLLSLLLGHVGLIKDENLCQW